MSNGQIPQIFNGQRRRALLDRAGANGIASSFLWQHIADELQSRVSFVSRSFSKALFIGPIGYWSQHIAGDRNWDMHYAALNQAQADDMQCGLVDEDALPFDPGSFDIIVTAGTLDSVNDLPGALIQIRRCLQPDGLMLASLFGSGSLMTLKQVLMRADGDRVMPHIHPQIDLRSAADLLSRTGFALPVADLDILNVRYSDWRTLIADLRCGGIGNALAGPRTYNGKSWPSRIEQSWNALTAADGKVDEQFAFLQLIGWSPSPDQPKPAKRGSGSVSLAEALKPKSA
jgi:NADH dehydrogenase [ubiquinone] 1 alpha subcomplex assembly factor 5